jgi:Sulfotransferase domain
MSLKIFQIGFNRCGTKTIHDYLCANGLQGVHWDKGRLAKRIFTNRQLGRDLISGYESCQVFTDMEWLEPTRYLEAYKLYPELAKKYPDAVFILNTRDREAWIKSRLSHGEGRYAALHKAYLGIESDSDLTEYWRSDWDRHHEDTIKFFAAGTHRFLICRIQTDLPDLLNCTLSELKLDPLLYSINAGREPRGGLRRLRGHIKRQLRSAFAPARRIRRWARGVNF